MTLPAVQFSEDQAEAWDRVAETLRGAGSIWTQAP